MITRELPEELHPAQGMLNGLIIGVVMWAGILGAIFYKAWHHG